MVSCVVENRSQCTTMFNMEWIGPFFQDFIEDDPLIESKNLIQLSENDKLKAYTLLSKPYLQDAYLSSVPDPQQQSTKEARFKGKLSEYKAHLKAMVAHNYKFEVEALLARPQYDLLSQLIHDKILVHFFP